MAGDMRIAIIGQDAFGGSVLDALVQAGETVVAVFLPPDREGRPPDPTKAAAEGHNIPVFQFRRMRNQAAVDAFKEVNADLCVMAFVTDIIPDAILEAPAKGTIQYHPSLLPRHRGPSSINWPIIQGETGTGLSIFWPDKGLDTGPVLLQKEIAIGPDDTLGTIYFNKIFQLGVDAMLGAVDFIATGNPPRSVQDSSKASYESFCKREHAKIDWSQPVDDVYNLIRGTNPQPGAWTTCAGKTLQIFDSAKISNGAGAPGEITGVSEEGITVAAQGGAILVKRVRPESAGKMPAGEFAASAGIATGARLG